MEDDDGGAVVVVEAVVDAVCGDLAEWGVELRDMGLGPCVVVHPPHTRGGGRLLLLLPFEAWPPAAAVGGAPRLKGGEWIVSLWVITGSMWGDLGSFLWTLGGRGGTPIDGIPPLGGRGGGVAAVGMGGKLG